MKIRRIVEKSENEPYPILVLFQNGTLRKKKKGLKLTVNALNEGIQKKKEVKITTDDNQEFIGEEETSVGRTFIVVQKAETNEVHMIEVASANLMNSVLKSKTDVKATEKDYFTRQVELQKAFGGKKSIRVVEKSQKLRINTSINESSLLSTVKEIKEREAQPSISAQIDESLTSILPPCHRDAEHVSKVYLLHELVGQQLLNLLGPNAKSLLNEAKERFGQFASSLLKGLSDIDEATAVALLMIDGTINFIKLQTKHLKQKGTNFSESEFIEKRIIELFCYVKPDGKWSRSLSLRDKAVAFVMAIGFVIGNYAIPLGHLSEDTGYGIRKLSTLCRVVGGVSKARGSTVYILKLPLPDLPRPSAKRRSL